VDLIRIFHQSSTNTSFRISKIRNIPEEKLNNLIIQNTEKAIFGFFGTDRVNVLSLNKSVDQLKQ